MQKTKTNFTLPFPKSIFAILLSIASTILWAQPKMGFKIDGVAAVVGNEIVAESDIQRELFRAQQQGGGDITKCQFLDYYLVDKFILHHAKQDTLITITDDRISGQADYQLNQFRSRASDEQIMGFYGVNTLSELRTEIEDVLRDKAYIDRKREMITDDTDATPEEIREFFNKNIDQLPDVPEELEIAHLVMYPELSEESRKVIIDKLEATKKEIEDGASFATKAILLSEDPGSSSDGGLIKNVRRGIMVPEFDAVVFNLQEGEISEPFETEFGFHIAFLEKRKGQTIDLRHILIQPKPNQEEVNAAFAKMDSIRQLILDREITFKEAVNNNTVDKYTKYNAGVLSSPETGESRFDRNALPVKMLGAIVGLKEGGISYVFEDEFNKKKVVRMLEVKRIIPAHKVNFETDFARLKNYTIFEKKARVQKEWVQDHTEQTFIKIHKDYQSCDFEFNWLKN